MDWIHDETLRRRENTWTTQYSLIANIISCHLDSKCVSFAFPRGEVMPWWYCKLVHLWICGGKNINVHPDDAKMFVLQWNNFIGHLSAYGIIYDICNDKYLQRKYIFYQNCFERPTLHSVHASSRHGEQNKVHKSFHRVWKFWRWSNYEFKLEYKEPDSSKVFSPSSRSKIFIHEYFHAKTSWCSNI